MNDTKHKILGKLIDATKASKLNWSYTAGAYYTQYGELEFELVPDWKLHILTGERSVTINYYELDQTRDLMALKSAIEEWMDSTVAEDVLANLSGLKKAP